MQIPGEMVKVTLASDLDAGAALPSNSFLLEPPANVCQVAFEKLCDVLRSCDDLPLSFQSITSGDPSLRSCLPFDATPITDNALPDGDPMTFHDVIPIVAQFESSARWPEDLTAIARIKT